MGAVAALSLALLPAEPSASGVSDQLRVGLVLQSTNKTGPYDGLAFRGFERAVRELGGSGG